MIVVIIRWPRSVWSWSVVIIISATIYPVPIVIVKADVAAGRRRPFKPISSNAVGEVVVTIRLRRISPLRIPVIARDSSSLDLHAFWSDSLTLGFFFSSLGTSLEAKIDDHIAIDGAQ